MTDWTAKQIGKYEIKELLGRGGMGEVYKAYHPALQRDVAIKMIHSHIAADPETIDRFRREARIVAALRHPGIVQVHDFDIEGDTFYMVMEFVPGQTLESRLRAIHAQNGRMPLPEALRLFQLIGQAVAYAHSQGVVHLDLKPGNVLLFSPPLATEDEDPGSKGRRSDRADRRRAEGAVRPILADFGLSKIIGAERMADPGTISGTPSYISPEQCLGQVGNERSDIYSLGIMLYQLTTGALPFSGDSPVALIFKHIDEPPPPPRSLNPDLPEALEQLIQKTLAKNPADRYQSAGAMLEALDEVVVPIGGVPSALLDVDTSLPDAEHIRCPYRGLQAFEEEHAEFYFGREALVERLVKQLQVLVRPDKSANPITGGAGRFLAVLGASGSGKSSLLQAGLIPALRAGALADGATWSICLMKPGEQPLAELAAQLAPLLWPPLNPPQREGGSGAEAGDGDRVKAARQLLDNLAADGRTLHLAVRLASPFAPPQPPLSPPQRGGGSGAEGRRQGAGKQRLLLVVDQFEEIFTLCRDEAERRRFIENLLYAAAASEGPVTVLLAMRADFYHRCAAYDDLARRIAAQQVLVGAMNEAELQRAITQPALHVGLKFEPGLVKAVLADIARQPGALPLLQHALLELWERRQGRLLTSRAYQLSGGVQGAIAQRADAVYESFSPAEQAIVRRIMLRLTELGQEGTQATRRRARLAELISRPEDAPLVEAVLKRLADARLIITAEETVEVVHEALIRGWPALQGWLEEDQEGLRIHRHLTEAAREWVALDRDPDALYRGARLATAGEWAADHVDELNPLEREFLAASQDLVRRREAEQEAQRQRELAQTQALAEAEHRRAEVQARASKRLGVLAAVLLGLLVLTVAAVWVAVSRQRVLDARRLAFAAQSQLEIAPETALLLAYESASRLPEFQTEQALRDVLGEFTWQPTYLNGHQAPLVSATFSPDGRYILTAFADGLAQLWDLTNQSALTLEGHEEPLISAAFSPDGAYILTAAEDKTARLWDLSGQLLTTFDHDDDVTSAVFSPPLGGTEGGVLTASADGTARLWDLTGQLVLTFEGHEDEVLDAVFSPFRPPLIPPEGGEGGVLTASADGTARLWDLTGQVSATFEGHEDEVTTAIFSPPLATEGRTEGGPGDGQTILTASRDKTARLWDLTGRQLAIFPHREQVTRIMFSPDGQYILTTAGRENTVRVWDITTKQQIATFHGHTRPILAMVVTPDGKRVLTASEDGTTRLWDLMTGQPLVTLKGHTDAVVSALFSPLGEDQGGEGQTILTASEDGTVRLWHEVGQPLPTLRGHTDEVESVLFSADGEHILTASTDTTARLWDLEGRTLVIFEGHEEQINSALFSPDEQYILTASEDSTARLWDLSGPQLATFDHEDEVGSAVFSPDEERVLTASDDGTAKLWDLSGQLLVTFEGHEGEVESAVFSPLWGDQGGVLTASEDGTARLWDPTGRQLASFDHEGQVGSAIFSPDGEHVLTVSEDSTARLWDLSGRQVAILQGHADEIEKAVFSPQWGEPGGDGKRILTASWDRTARLWDQEGRLLATFAGHTNVVKWAVFSPDGRHVLTASDDGTARLWDLEGHLLDIFRRHENWVAAAIFSPDGKRIATASRDHTVRQYLVNLEDLLTMAACRVSRGLTEQEIEQFGIDQPRFVFEQRRC